jgi:hypothetical protein
VPWVETGGSLLGKPFVPEQRIKDKKFSLFFHGLTAGRAWIFYHPCEGVLRDKTISYLDVVPGGSINNLLLDPQINYYDLLKKKYNPFSI